MFSHRPPYWNETKDSFLEIFNEDSFDYTRYDPDNCWINIDLESNKSQRLLNKLAKDFIESIQKRFWFG